MSNEVEKEEFINTLVKKIAELPTVWLSVPGKEEGYHRQVNLVTKGEVLNILTAELGYTVKYESI